MPHHEDFSTEPLLTTEDFSIDTLSQHLEDDIRNTPSSTTSANSPAASLASNRPPSRNSELVDPKDAKEISDKDSASGRLRSRSSSAKSDKEKRKRSRVTPEQLSHLETFFLLDRSPTAARRREISEMLGMQERQTQIWFQNRRAKAKLQDGKNKTRSGSTEAPPDTPPQLSPALQVDLHNLIHETEPVTIIPCTDLTIGTWRRMASVSNKYDLIAYVCEVKRCLTWFIHSSGFGFKMELPFHTIIDTEFTNLAPASGIASFTLSEPPIFYLEHVSPANDRYTMAREWRTCGDWTEGLQATNVLCHTLVGSAVQLAHVLRNLQGSTASSDVTLYPPSYRTEVVMTPSVDLSTPSPSNLSGPGFPFPNSSRDVTHLDRQHQPHRRTPYSGPGLLSPLVGEALRLSSHSPQDNSFSQNGYQHQLANRGAATPSGLAAPMYSNYHPASQASSFSSSWGSSIPQSLTSSPYQPAPRSYYNGASRLLQQHKEPIRQTHLSHHQSFNNNAPFPGILTTPYHPQSHLIDHEHDGSTDQSNGILPPMSQLQRSVYDSDRDLQRNVEE